MIPDALYDLAFQFKKTKLWRQLFDTQLFALVHSDGTIGYCCVMGALEEHLALAVYPGEMGLDSYRNAGADRSEMNPFEERESILSQDCVMVSFECKDELKPRELAETRAYCEPRKITLRGENAFPQFQRFRPHHFPWYIDDEKDQAYLHEALEACLEVAVQLKTARPEDLGFTEGPPFERKIPLLERSGDSFLWQTVLLPAPRPVAHPAPVFHDDIALAKLATFVPSL
jgi:hypothetical protein